MGLTIKDTPFYRYTYFTQFSFQLLESYINSIEEQIKISKEDYKQKKQTIYIDDDPEMKYPEMNTMQIIDVHNGLDSQTWDLDEIFEQHFPNIQRKSALLSLYSFFEHELIQLCILFKKAENFNLDIEEINGKGIISKAIIYLEKVACLQIKDWSKVHDIRKIRNLIVHNEGKLINNAGKELKEKKIVERTKFLNGNSELLIEEGYLSYVFQTFKTQFEIIDKEIKNKYPDK